MRTVFSNAQCAHVWAQQNQEQRAAWTAPPRVLRGFTLAYMVAWHRRAPSDLAAYLEQHGERVTLEGASVHDGSAYAVNAGWPGINWDAEPMGDNSAIWR